MTMAILVIFTLLLLYVTVPDSDRIPKWIYTRKPKRTLPRRPKYEDYVRGQVEVSHARKPTIDAPPLEADDSITEYHWR
jgi:hypothetical protein